METQSQEIKELAAALAKAQALIKPAKKDVENTFFKSKYADLAAVHEACIHALTENGLSVTQSVVVGAEGKGLLLITTLLHVSGQWLKSYMPITPVKQDPQGIGSAITYMRRYTLAALVGVATEDDDGNEASGNKEGKKTPQQAKAFDMELDRAQQEQIHEEAIKKLSAADSLEKLAAVWMPYQKSIKKMDEDLAADLIQKKDECKAELMNGSTH